MSGKEFVSLLKDTFQKWGEDNAARLAAALSYYTIFSLAPLLVIAIAVAGLFLGQQAVQQQILDQVTQAAGPDTAQLVESMISNLRNREANILVTIIGVVTLLVGASGVFGQLKDALNTIWDVAPEPDGGIMVMIRERFLSFTMVLGIGFLLLVSLAISAALSIIANYFSDLLPGSELLWQIMNFIISFGVITLLFAMIYKILPDVKIAWSDVWLGAAVTALLFSIGRWLISLYLANAGAGSAYGAAGSLAILLLWVYYSAQILFFGAEFTQVYANRYGKEIVPEEGAVRLSRLQRMQEGLPGEVPEKGEEEAAAAVQLTKPPQPSFLALSTILATLAGFITGLIVRSAGSSKE